MGNNDAATKDFCGKEPHPAALPGEKVKVAFGPSFQRLCFGVPFLGRSVVGFGFKGLSISRTVNMHIKEQGLK
jgi:hypothetical protein